MSFKVIPDGDYCKVQVKSKGNVITQSPEEISATVLRKMKRIAENCLGQEVTKAVITVPAYFNDSQRQATINAGNLAGLQILRIMNEPTAAAIAYGNMKQNMEGTFLVFDMGGGTLDVSIIRIQGPRFIIRSTSGCTNFGGEDINNKLVEYIADLFEKKHNKNIKNNKRALERLKKECEDAKKSLSFKQEAQICVDNIVDGIDLNEQLTRAKFNWLNEAFFISALEPVKKALESATMIPSDVEKIIMVGGSSRIPKLQSLLKEFFNCDDVYMSINPDEAIAYGAGVMATVLNGVEMKSGRNFIVQDVTPMSLSTDTINGASVLIPRNSSLPFSETKTYKTIIDNQAVIHCDVYEGDSESAEKNYYLGRASLTNIPRGRAGSEKCDLTFAIDENGVLSVTAVLQSTGEEHEIVVDRNYNN